jgi:hypothetical protein
VTLIKEVNDLRRELKGSRSKIQDLQSALGISRKNAATTTDAIVQALHADKGISLNLWMYILGLLNEKSKIFSKIKKNLLALKVAKC